MWEELTAYCDLCGLSCKPPQSYASLRRWENNTECVYVCKKKVLIGSVPHSVSHWPFFWSAAVMTRRLEIQRGKSSLNWFAWVQGIRFLLTEGQKEMHPKKKTKSARKWKENQREAEEDQVWERLSVLRDVVTMVNYKALTKSHLCQILVLQQALSHNGAMSVKAMGSKWNYSTPN